MAKVNQVGLAKLQARLTPLALRGAERAAEVLRDKLSGEGSGRKYASLPNRSSSETEYPAEQAGDLRDSIDARVSAPGRACFGPINNPPVEAGYLHFSNEGQAAIMHFRPPSDGGRPFMDDALQDRDIHRAVLEGVKGS